MEDTTIPHNDFATLSNNDRVRMLAKLDLVYGMNSPLLCRYILSFMRQYRDRLRVTAPNWVNTVGDTTKDLYCRLRLSLTVGDVNEAINMLQGTQNTSHADLNTLSEFIRNILTECFNALHWSETHQKQWVELRPSIERHHVMRFAQEVMSNANLIGVERTEMMISSITGLLQSLPPDQSITMEHLYTLFEVK